MTALLAMSISGVTFGTAASVASGPPRATGPIVWGCLAIVVALVERRRVRGSR